MKITAFAFALSLAAFSANANPFAGTYLPQGEKENGATCESLAGSFGGKTPYRIEEGWIEYMEAGCKLSKPKKFDDGSVRYRATCASEGNDYSESLTMKPSKNGISLKGDGWQEYWQSCGQKNANSGNSRDKSCSLVGATFTDQNGETARVGQIRECFGWYDRQLDASSEGCKTFEERTSEISKTSQDEAVVGTRLYDVVYRGQDFVFSEHVQVGLPWYFQGVNPSINGDAGWISMDASFVTEMIESEENVFRFESMSFFDGSNSREARVFEGKVFEHICD
jgi:hypothetical protein